MLLSDCCLFFFFFTFAISTETSHLNNVLNNLKEAILLKSFVLLGSEMGFKKKVLAVFVLGILLRVFVLGLPIVDDNATFGLHARARNQIFVNFIIIPLPPLDPWFYELSCLLFGINSVSLRLVPVFFSLATAAVVFLAALRFFGKKTALFSAAIYLFSFFPFYSVIAMTADNTFLTLAAAAMLFLTMNAKKEEGVRNSVFLGVLLGLALMAKINAIIFALPVLAVFFIYKKNLRGFLSNAAVFGLSTALVAGAFLSFIFIAMPENFSFFIETVLGHNQAYPNALPIQSAVMQLFPLAAALTPLFLLVAFFLYRRSEAEKIPSCGCLLSESHTCFLFPHQSGRTLQDTSACLHQLQQFFWHPRFQRQA